MQKAGIRLLMFSDGKNTQPPRKNQASNLNRGLCREAFWGYSHPMTESVWHFHNTFSTSVFQLGKWPREGLLFTSVWGFWVLDIAMMMLAIVIPWKLQLFSIAYNDPHYLKKQNYTMIIDWKICLSKLTDLPNLIIDLSQFCPY